MKNPLLFLLLFVTFAGNLHAQREPESEASLKQILADWQKRRDQTDSVLYEVEGKTTFVKGAFNDDPNLPKSKEDIPPRDYSFPLKMKWLLDFRKNWILKEAYEEMFFEGKSWLPRHSTVYFDGTDLKVYEPRSDNPNPELGNRSPDLTIQTKRYWHLVFTPIDAPVFFANGILDTAKGVPGPQLLKFPLEPGQFRLHGVGMINGNKQLVLRTVARKIFFYEYWVDPAKEGFITRCVTFSDGKVFSQVDIWPQKTQWGWLPKKWEVSTYLRGVNFPDRLEQLTVNNVMLNPVTKIEDFQIAASPGLIVYYPASGKIHEVGRVQWWFFLLPILAFLALWFFVKRKGYFLRPKGFREN